MEKYLETKQPSKRYVAIFHLWFMDSVKFKHVEIIANSLEDAQQQAQSVAYEMNEQFKRCAAHVIEIDATEALVNNFNHKLLRIPRWVRKLFNADV